VQPSAASSSGAGRSRASITATSTSSRCTGGPPNRLRPLLQPCACARSGVHMQPGLSAWRFVRGLDSIIAQHSPLRGYATHTHWCSALVWHGSAGLAAAHQRTHSGDALLRSKMRIGQRPRVDARAA
jgi:hypothetical protein